ncbi:MAG TPA: helix-turn-helix domain-containing protein [Chloroflexota bacterium]|nr:helix-turn-helix domain-containing protein [Chloroflexota bacterium]
MERLYTVNEAAGELRISLRCLYGWLSEGRVRGLRLNGSGWRIPESALSEVLTTSAARAVAPTTSADRTPELAATRMGDRREGEGG